MREGWELKTLADLFDIGSSKRVYESQWRDSGVPFYRAREIVKLSRDGFVDNELFIDEDLYKEYANKYGIPKCGDIMVTGVGTLGVCYVVKENDRFYFKDGNTLWFKTKKDTNPFFVNYAFKSNHIRQQIENCNGATVGTFTIVRAKQTTIPVPPIEEQELIVSELDLLSDIIEKKKAQLKEYDQLAQSIFYDMFGDPVTNEKGWEVKTFGEIGDVERGAGISKKDFVDEGLPCVHYGQLHTILGPTTKKHYTSIPTSLLPKYKIAHTGDLIMAITSEDVEGSCKSTAWLGGYDVVVGSDAAIFHHEQNGTFLSYYTMTKAFYNEKAKYAKGFKVTHISAKEIESISVYLPPLSLQQQFAEKIEAIEKQKELIQQSIKETETLFNSRMDYYFN